MDAATLQLRKADDGVLAGTILLEAPQELDGERARTLEATLKAVAPDARITLVVSHHKKPGDAPAPSPPRPPSDEEIARGHANPLGIPNAQKVTDADRDSSMRARPALQRPGNASRVIAVASGKGGVGKSTVAARLALALSARGDKVGLLDLDIYGPSLPVLFDLDGVRPEVKDGKVMPLTAAGLTLMSIGFLVDQSQALAWRGPMVMGASKQLLDDVSWPSLDWLIIDTPPGTGDAHITLLQRTRIDGAVIVTTPSPLAVADVRRGAALFRKMNTPILGLVENMAALPDGTAPFGDGLDDAALAELDLVKLARLPLDARLGGTIGSVAPTEVEVTAPFDALADAVDGQLAQSAT